ncbi:MAG: nucleotide exchange factor GrpE [Hyphomicrobiaceae bacterium]
MTNDNRPDGENHDSTPTPPHAAEASAGHDAPPTDQTTNAQSASQQKATAQPSEADKLSLEVAELKDRLLRTHAEMENVRKRLEREKADIAKYAISKFAKDVIEIGDNVQRAIGAVPTEAAEHDEALKSFLEGVTMIEREFLNVLERHGVKRMDPKGEPVNPQFHQAVMEMPVPNVPSGTVAQVCQPGYTIEDRVLRPAMVVVAKGGMKPQATDQAQPQATPANDAAQTSTTPPSDDAESGQNPASGHGS